MNLTVTFSSMLAKSLVDLNAGKLVLFFKLDRMNPVARSAG